MANPTPNPNPKLKAAIYARVSTRDKGQDVDNQLIPLRLEAKSRGWNLIREYTEHESAAGKVKRKQFSEMMAAAARGEFQVLAFWSLDRFSREGVAQTLLDLRKLEQAGVFWYSHVDPIPGLKEAGPFRDVAVAMMAALAQIETNRRRERALAAVERKRAAGEPVGSIKMAIDRGRVEELLAQDFPLKSIARDLGISRGTLLNRLDEWGLRNTQASTTAPATNQ